MGPICANMIIVVADLLNYRNLYHALHSIPELVHLLSIMCCSSLNETEFYLQNLLKMSFPNALVTESKKIIYWRSIGVIVFFEVNHLYCDENSAAITEIFVT